jgi:hypothetical protein
MFSLKIAFFAIIATTLLSVNVLAQGSNPAAPAASAVTTVQVTANIKEAEVGQQVKVTAVATDASGNIVKEQPSTYFAGPFDIAAVDDDGNVKLFGVGEVTVGAIVGGKPGLTTFTVKAPSVKTVEITPLKTPFRSVAMCRSKPSRAFSTVFRAPVFRSTGRLTTRKLRL